MIIFQSDFKETFDFENSLPRLKYFNITNFRWYEIFSNLYIYVMDPLKLNQIWKSSSCWIYGITQFTSNII